MSEWTRPAQPVRCIVDLSAPLTVRRERGVLVQGDENANAIVAEVYQTRGTTKAVPYDLTGATVTLTFVRPDNLAAPPITAEITGENHNIAIATLTDTCYRHSGVYAASLKLHTGDTDRTILRLIGDIISTETDGTVTNEQLFPTPEELLVTLQQVEEARDNANAAAANANTAAIAANNAAQNIDAKVGNAVTPLNEEITNLESVIDSATKRSAINYLYDNSAYDLSGSTVDLDTRIESVFRRCTYLECASGEEFELNIVGGKKARAYGFVDLSGNILEVAPETTTYNGLKIIAPGGTKYLILNDDKANDGVCYRILSIATRLNGLESVATPDGAEIACYGDSLTYGYNASSDAHRYPSILSGLTGRKVYNLGVAGESSDQILARQMGYPAWIEPITIPESASQSVELIWHKNSLRSPNTVTILNASAALGAVEIGGVSGTLLKNGDATYFRRAQDGPIVKLSRPSYIKVTNAEKMNDCTQIIWIGTNGGWFVSADNAARRIQKLCAQIDAMIEKLKTKKYIIIGLTYYYDFVAANGLTPDMLEEDLKLRYGSHFLNIKKYLTEYGLDDAGIIPSPADEEAMLNGSIPPSLLSEDGIHGNDAFYEIVANLVYRKGKMLGYWD